MADTATADIPPPQDRGLMPALAAGRGPLYSASVGPLDDVDKNLSSSLSTRQATASNINTNVTKATPTSWQSTVDWWVNNGGVPIHVAQGIADNVQRESSFRPDLISQDTGGPSGGLYQAHLDRLKDLQSKPNWQNPDVQHQWALEQLNGGDPISTQHRNEIFNAGSREEANQLFKRYFERPASTNLSNTQVGSLDTYQQSQARSTQLINERQASLDKLISSLGSSKSDSQERRKLLQDSLDRSRALQDEMLNLAHNPPTQKPTDLMSTFGSLAMLVGAIGGLKSRQPATAALEAAAGVIEGVHQSNTEEFGRNFKTWQTQSKLLEELTGMQANDFRMIIENDRLDETQRHNELEEKLHEWGMGNSLMQLQLGNIEEAWKGPLTVMQAHEQLMHTIATTEEAFARAHKEEALASGAGLKNEQLVDTGNLDPQGRPTPYVKDNTGTYRVEMQVDESGQTHQVKTPYNPVAPAKMPSSGSQTGRLPPETLQRMAKQYVSTGDRSMLTGLGYGSAGAANRADLQAAITEEMKNAGVPPEEMGVRIAEFQGIMAGERTLGQRTANIGMAVASAEKLLPLAKTASDTTPRSKYPTLNEWMLAAERQMGDTAPIKLSVAVNSFLNAYSRAVAPTGVPTDDVRKHAYELLSKAYNQGQFNSALEQMSLEMQAEQQAPGTVRGEFRKAVMERVSKDHPEASTGGAVSPGGVIHYDAQGNRVQQ